MLVVTCTENQREIEIKKIIIISFVVNRYRKIHSVIALCLPSPDKTWAMEIKQ